MKSKRLLNLMAIFVVVVLGLSCWYVVRSLTVEEPEFSFVPMQRGPMPVPPPRLPPPQNPAPEPPNYRVKSKDAIMAGDTKAATKFALELLKENATRKVWPEWQFGNNVHEANQILGMAALREGRRADAKRFLIAAGKTPGSPQLDSFGPNMVLAQELLAKGEKETVCNYLDLVAKFWANTPPSQLNKMERKTPGISAKVRQLNRTNQKQINDWKRQIRAGKKPTLNNSDALF